MGVHMNRKIEEYKKKANRIVKTIEIIAIAVFLLGVLISIIYFINSRSKSLEENPNSSNGDGDYVINLENNTIVYENHFELTLDINNFEEESLYQVLISIDNDTIIETQEVYRENKYNIELTDEGKKEININIYKDNEKIKNIQLTIYYIEPYVSQYLDTLTVSSVTTHYRTGSYENYQKDINILSNLGINYIRTDFFWGYIYTNNQYNFSKYDTWINDLKENHKNIKILGILTTNENLIGNDKKINNEEELKGFTEFCVKVAEHYPQITDFQILNEPNNGRYITDEDIEWYKRVVEEVTKALKSVNSELNIFYGSLSAGLNDKENYLSSKTFFDKAMSNDIYKSSKYFTYNVYYDTEMKLNMHKEQFNNFGGFIKQAVTEYGSSSYNKDDEQQSIDVITQSVLLDNYDIEYKNLYNFWSTSTDSTLQTGNYGLVNNDYTPKPSYYSMKNYYTNTNGSEYIGTLDIEDGLEAHVYDKDGKPLIIAWSDNTDNTYDFTLGEMTAKDIYGKDITPDESGNIQITTSPVYLYNVGNHYFYQAISNTVTQKYDEFTSNFSGEIAKVSGLQASIDNLKQKIQDISSNSTLDETTAINLMEQHYNLGNTIIQAYKSGNLQVEYVKLSSMLDMLDDIGDSFEDLVTVSAKTRNVDLTDTLNSITNAGNLINDSDIEMVYPTKILEFSQDFYDKANYINGLEEENDIKTGLIVSKNLHSKLLANWAIEFANLYVDEYIANNPVEIEYSTIDYTNQDVTATLKTNANITVTNNSNSKTYTFNQNGSFTFEYTIKGRAFTKTATVSNIDKAAPTVTGVENDKLYLDSITPQIQDENLQEVKLYKDNNEVQNYQTNTTISEDGNYKIVAIDKASNQIETAFYISRNPATISYSATDLTNQDVIATINSNFDVEVLNNSNQNTYTFNQNGEFTFEIKIKGTLLNLTATVNNIDKTPPVITGVEENKQYIDKAIPMVTDENLNEVKLYLNSYLEEGYVPGTELTEEGFYKLVVNDKAGNEVTVEFRIMEDISEEYIRKGSYIINIKNNTTLSEFDQKIDMGLDYEIVRNGNPLAENDIIATGDILRTSAGEELTLIVSGDINKDGDVNIKDIVKLRKYLLVRNNLDELELIAADCNIDGRSISIKDLIRMRLIVLERGVT